MRRARASGILIKVTAKLTRAQAELVLKRAAELEAARNEDGDDAIALAEIERLGQEVGLSQRAVSQAVAEWERGQLAPPEPQLGDRVFGDPYVEVSRWVPRAAGRVDRALAKFMNEQLMVVERQSGDRVEWVQAPGLFAGLSRSLAFAHRYSFGPASRVETLVVEDDGGSFVSFRIELGAARRLGATALAWRGAALSAMALLMAQGASDLSALLGFVGASGAGMSALWWAERRRFAQLRAQAAVAPTRFLNGLMTSPRRRIGGPRAPTEDGGDADRQVG